MIPRPTASTAALLGLVLLAAPLRAADWSLQPVEKIGDIQLYSVPDPANPQFKRLLARPPGDGPFPAVVLNHGGRTGADFIRDCLAFPRAGFVTIACDLRHKEIPVEDFRNLKWEPGMGPGTSTEDLRRNREEIEILRRLPFVQQDALAMYGHSGGGLQTVGFIALANHDRAIRVAAGTAAGIYPKDPEHLKDPRNPGKFRTYRQLGHVKAMSAPRESIKDITVPLLTIHGRLDHICPVEASLTLKEEMDRLGKDNTLIIREQSDHNQGMRTAEDFAAIIGFFRKHLAAVPDAPSAPTAAPDHARKKAKASSAAPDATAKRTPTVSSSPPSTPHDSP
jgi:dienelactone hydrolase